MDIAIIETGLGGRLDATNVITPLVSVITTITYDHIGILGETFTEITAEKAGIIKKDVPVVLGNIPDESRPVINKKAQEMQAPVHDSLEYHPEFNDNGYLLNIKGEQVSLQSSLKTPVQAYNIAVAWQVTEVLRRNFPVNDNQRKDGIRKVKELFSHTGRFELLQPELPWYFDGAHNVQAVQEMKKAVRSRQPIDQTILVLSMMKDKVRKNIMDEFLDFKKICYHSLPLERAATLQKVQQWLPEVQPIPVERDARNTLFKELESKLVIFAGSFYFYPTVVNWISDYMERP